MKLIVAGREVISRTEFAEAAMGIDPELFAGVPGESADERVARVDVARDVLKDLWREDPDAAAFAARLLAETTTPAQASTCTAVGRWAA